MENKNKFTPEQQKVIDSRGKNLIVSAAAGSGKTTVMIERIKDLIVKEKVPIENFLVVTFTKASSEDMKSRLISKLSCEESTPFLLDQIDNVSTADVSNLHSFCARLLKSYFYEAGIDPTFVVLSDEEAQNLREKALNILFEQEFDNQNQNFFELIDVLQKNRSDGDLRLYILKLHEFFNVIFNKEEWFKKCLKSLYNSNLNKNQACNIINGYVVSRIEKIQEQVSEKIQQYNQLKLTNFVAYLQEMQSALLSINSRNGFVKNSKNIFEIPTFGVPPKVEEVFADHRSLLDLFRKNINAEISNFQANYISPDEELLKEELAVAKRLATTLYESTNKFQEIYAGLKKEKGGLDYNDLEQFTIKVLENPEILGALKQKYKYVFVDEYQDINAVQEKIITMLSGQTNRFMVGDIKQSIYRFRLCDPDIFLKKYNDYKTEENSESIDLSKNFRSNRHILNFVNLVFCDRMTEDFGGIDYKQSAQLAAGSLFEEDSPVQLCYIDSTNLGSTNKEVVDKPQVYSIKNHVQTEELENLKSRGEATYIAQEILDLVSNKTIYDGKLGINRPIRFKDIAILIPARNEFLESLIEVFAEFSIPLSTDASEDVLKDKYVKSIYNYLKLIYNYKQDIELFSVLYSPLSDFTLNELAQLRIFEPDCRFFYQCLDNCAINDQISANIQEKLEKFKRNLQKYRNISGYKPIKDVVFNIISDYSVRNLILLERDGKERLSLLEKFIDSLPDSNIYEYFADGNLANLKAEKTTDANAVQVVTIHKSKGLEYPIAFVSNIARQFNMQSLRGNMLISKDLGLAMDYFNQLDRYKNVSLAKEAIKLTETRKTIEEQQRLLYVALTRAINKLYVVGCKNIDKVKPHFPERQSSFSDWFDNFVFDYLNGNNLENVQINVINAENLIINEKKNKNESIILSSADENLNNIVQKSILNQYSNLAQTLTPQKMSVTQIANGSHESEEFYQRYNYSSDRSSIEKGNAYHKLMQHINFDCLTEEDLNKNIKKLLDEGKITEEELNLIDTRKIKELLNNSEFQSLIRQGRVLREQEFFMNVSNDDVLIVQGVVDLLIINNSEATVVDYKTGNFSNPESLKKYQKQIEMYCLAIEKAFSVKVQRKAIIAIEQAKIVWL